MFAAQMMSWKYVLNSLSRTHLLQCTSQPRYENIELFSESVTNPLCSKRFRMSKLARRSFASVVFRRRISPFHIRYPTKSTPLDATLKICQFPFSLTNRRLSRNHDKSLRILCSSSFVLAKIVMSSMYLTNAAPIDSSHLSSGVRKTFARNCDNKFPIGTPVPGASSMILRTMIPKSGQDSKILSQMCFRTYRLMLWKYFRTSHFRHQAYCSI